MNNKDFDALKERMEAEARRHFIDIDFQIDDTPTGGKQITMHPYRAPDEEGQSSGADVWSKAVVCPANDPNMEKKLTDAIKAAALELYPGEPTAKR